MRLTPVSQGIARACAANSGERLKLRWDRYRQLDACAEAVKDIAGPGAKPTVLDVGSGDGALCLFLPDYEVDVLRCDTAGGGIIEAGDRSYDVVVSADVVDHFEPRQRGIFIACLAKICRLACIVNFCLPASSTAQKVVAAMTQDPLINEHVRLGLPYSSTISKSFEDMGFQCSARQHTSRALWATFLALQHTDPDAAASISRYLIEDAAPEPPTDPLYETIIAKRGLRITE